nr:hypothetical protein [Tanacetum cinerariifolium]
NLTGTPTTTYPPARSPTSTSGGNGSTPAMFPGAATQLLGDRALWIDGNSKPHQREDSSTCIADVIASNFIEPVSAVEGSDGSWRGGGVSMRMQ